MPLEFPDIPPERISTDPVERRLYSRDLAPVPPLLAHAFFETRPEVIIRPADATQTAQALRAAARQRLPVTPRAAASTSFYNAVPTRGGLVLDVNDLRGGIELDAAQATVRVLPGTTWFELDDALRQQGFAVRSYPSSAISATVGGWVSTQGHGFGSLAHGSLGGQLRRLQVALPGGELRSLTRDSDPPLDWFVGAEGTLGVITEVELEVRPCPAVEAQHLLAFDSLDELGRSVMQLASVEARPYTLFFADDGYLDLLRRGGFEAPAARGLLLTSFQGEPETVRQGQSALKRLAGRELPEATALEEWSLRLFHLRAKRSGPSLLAAEMWLPLKSLGPYLQKIRSLAASAHTRLGAYGLAVTPSEAQVMTLYPADERQPWRYLAAVGFTRRLYALGMRLGGRPYGVGLWNTAYLPQPFGAQRLRELRARKARLDPAGQMNPGKLYAAPFPLWPAVFAPGAAALSLAHGWLARRPA